MCSTSSCARLVGGWLLSKGLSLFQRLQRIHKSTSLSRTIPARDLALLPHRHFALNPASTLALCNRQPLDIVQFFQSGSCGSHRVHSIKRCRQSASVIAFSRPASRIRLNEWWNGVYSRRHDGILKICEAPKSAEGIHPRALVDPMTTDFEFSCEVERSPRIFLGPTSSRRDSRARWARWSLAVDPNLSSNDNSLHLPKEMMPPSRPHQRATGSSVLHHCLISPSRRLHV